MVLAPGFAAAGAGREFVATPQNPASADLSACRSAAEMPCSSGPHRCRSARADGARRLQRRIRLRRCSRQLLRPRRRVSAASRCRPRPNCWRRGTAVAIVPDAPAADLKAAKTCLAAPGTRTPHRLVNTSATASRWSPVTDTRDFAYVYDPHKSADIDRHPRRSPASKPNEACGDRRCRAGHSVRSRGFTIREEQCHASHCQPLFARRGCLPPRPPSMPIAGLCRQLGHPRLAHCPSCSTTTTFSIHVGLTVGPLHQDPAQGHRQRRLHAGSARHLRQWQRRRHSRALPVPAGHLEPRHRPAGRCALHPPHRHDLLAASRLAAPPACTLGPATKRRSARAQTSAERRLSSPGSTLL